MLASSSTTTIFGFPSGILFRSIPMGVRNVLVCTKRDDGDYWRGQGRVVLHFGEGGIALWCRWTGINFIIPGERGSGRKRRWLKFFGDMHQPGQRRDLHFLHNLRSMGLDRSFGGVEFRGNLFVE